MFALLSSQETRQPTPPTEGQATIRIIATGLCGSDREFSILFLRPQPPLSSLPSFLLLLSLTSLPSPCLTVHYYTHGRNGAFILQAPLVLGHEAGGKISALPEGYKGDLKVGDDVAIEAGVNCNKCKYCREGRYNLCSVSSRRQARCRTV